MTASALGRARAVACVVLGLVAASTLLGGSAHAQTGTDPDAGGAPVLGGYEGRAHSSGVHLFYNPQGVLPIAAVVDVGAPDALATISSGPVAFARAAIADPGDLIANPDALIAQLDSSWQSGTIPAYPYRITANSTIGEPRAELQPAPGLDSRVSATSEGSTSEASIAASSAPGLVTLGSVKSRATTSFDGSTVEVRARTEVSHFDLVGLLRIESIVTDVVARSSGGDTEVEGGTVVTGATFLGQPVIIDEEGIRTDPKAEKPTIPLLGPILRSLPGDLTKTLADAGIRISLPGVVEHDGETAGTIGATGLRIDLELSDRTTPVLGQLLGSLPPIENPIPGAPGIEDLVVLVRATHLAAIDVGRAQASLTARPAFVAPPFEAPSPGGTPSFGGNLPTPSLSPPIGRAPVASNPQAPTPVPVADPATPPSTTIETAPAASLGAGIGALALLALLAQPFIGTRLARAGAAVLATGPTDTCPLEER